MSTTKNSTRITGIIGALMMAFGLISQCAYVVLWFLRNCLSFSSYDGVYFDFEPYRFVSWSTLFICIYFFLFFCALVLLTMFAFTTIKGKAKSAIFTVGIAVWMVAWWIGDLDYAWYLFKGLVTHENFDVVGDVLEFWLSNCAVLLPLLILGVLSLVKIKPAWIGYIIGGFLFVGFVILPFFNTMEYIVGLLSNYYLWRGGTLLEIGRVIVSNGMRFCVAIGMIFLSPLAIKRRPKETPAVTEIPTAAPVAQVQAPVTAAVQPTVSAVPVAAPVSQSTVPAAPRETIDEIRRSLDQLHANGIITDEEYIAKLKLLR